MNTLISATEANKKSKVLLKEKISKEEKRKIQLENKLKKEKKSKNLEYKTSISNTISEYIAGSIKRGEFETRIILEEIWNSKISTSLFEFDDVIKELIPALENKGYIVRYGATEIYHDTTVDYMNSGGECGSSTPYYTTSLTLDIKWNNTF
jgi:hypothetical protein